MAKNEKEGTEDQPEYVTKEDMLDLVNKAVSTHLSRAVKNLKLEETIGAAVAQAISPIAEKLGAGQQEQQTQSTNASTSQLPPEIVAAMNDMKKQLATATDVIAKERQARTDAESRQQRLEERALLSAELKKHKIADSLLPAALALLVGEEQRVARDKDTGAITFRGPTDFGEEAMPLAKGVAAWAASDAAKAYRAATGAKGGPSGQGNPSLGGKTKDGKPEPMTYNKLGQNLFQLFGQMNANPSGLGLGGVAAPVVGGGGDDGNLNGGYEEG